MPTSPFNCLAIIVCYNPDVKLFKNLIVSILPQVNEVIIIDNASELRVSECLPDNLKNAIKYIQLDKNLGLGAAHNIGIEFAKEKKYSHVLVLDQDSIPAADMVAKLFFAEQQLIHQDKKLAAVGPLLISLHDNHKTAFIAEKQGNCDRAFCQKEEYIETLHLISSGSLISLSAIEKIGKMEEGLFIDYIDIEWCLRAKSLDYSCYGVCDALMYHQLGERNIHLTFLNRRIVLSSPIRYYYQFRNAMLLYRRSYVKWNWIKYHFPRHILIKFFLILFLVKPRLRNISFALLGLVHGIRGISGKFEE